MAVVKLDAGEYHYAEYGDRSAPPLVLLHGMPSDCSTWAGIAPELAADYRVITPDQRGHGASARTPGPLNSWGRSGSSCGACTAPLIGAVVHFPERVAEDCLDFGRNGPAVPRGLCAEQCPTC